MARDDTARDFDSDRSLLDRRPHRTLAGAAAASLAATDVADPADASSDDTATVPAGETSEIERTDTADGAGVEGHDVLQ